MKKIFDLKSILLAATLFSFMTLQVNAQEKKMVLQFVPHMDAIASQTFILAPGLNVGLGYYNLLNFYISGNIDYSRGKNIMDPYERDVYFNRLSIGVKAKLKLAGRNRYITDKYFHNMRLMLDFGGFYHVAPTQLYRSGELSEDQTVQYLSGDLGLSLMIPFGYLAKHRNRFLNRSDLFLEVLGSYLINNDVSLLYGGGSSLSNGTPALKINLNWTYYFKFSKNQ